MNMPQPSILHAIDTTGPGGAETIFLDLAENLKLDGYRTLAVIKGPGWVEDQLKARGISYQVVRPSSGFSLRQLYTLASIIRKQNVQLIQAHLLGSTLTFSILGLLLRIPVVSTIHGKVDVNPNEKLIFIKNLIMRLGINRLVTVSNDLKAYIVSRGLFNESSMQTIYNGIKTSKYKKNHEYKIRSELSLDDTSILIGSVGNIRPAKSYDVLIAAAKIVIERNPNAHFIIAGHKKASLMNELEQLISTLGIEKNIHFIGFQDDSAMFLGQMDIFLLSSSSEGFSISTIEAMATGLPVVVTRCGGPEEIVTNDLNGLIVDVNDPSALAAGIFKLLDNQQLASELGLSAQVYASDNFSLEKLIESYKNLYSEVLT